MTTGKAGEMPGETASRAARLEAVLTRDFTPLHLEVIDESALHAGHAGARAGGETHYRVTLVSERFGGLARVGRSRMVHAAVDAEFGSGLHALSLVLRAPGET